MCDDYVFRHIEYYSFIQMLAIQKIEEGALQLIFKPFTLHDLINISLNPFELLARDKGVKIVTAIADGIPMCVEGDKYRLKHVLSNLVSNAVKFTNRGSRVMVSMRECYFCFSVL